MSAGKIARPSIIVVAHTTDSKPAITEITCPTVPSRNGLNTVSSTIITTEATTVYETIAGLSGFP